VIDPNLDMTWLLNSWGVKLSVRDLVI
jgi:hypothetical protein